MWVLSSLNKNLKVWENFFDYEESILGDKILENIFKKSLNQCRRKAGGLADWLAHWLPACGMEFPQVK